MFVHISPEFDALGETLSTLKFAERVATVELGAARANKDSRSTEVKELREQVWISNYFLPKVATFWFLMFPIVHLSWFSLENGKQITKTKNKNNIIIVIIFNGDWLCNHQ